jgi:hypothetical protein
MDASQSSPSPSSKGKLGPDTDILAPRAGIEAESTLELLFPEERESTLAPAVPELKSLFTPPLSALSPLFRHRFEKIHACRVDYALDINGRPTIRVLGGYYKSRRLIRVYARDRQQGFRPVEELFDTFLHEMAHHLEYTEPFSFSARSCGRVPGRMHSRLFWRILGELKYRWTRQQRQTREDSLRRP